MAQNESFPTHFVAIGFTSNMHCYFGITEEEARERYSKETGDEELIGVSVKTVTIVDGSFRAYDAWSAD